MISTITIERAIDKAVEKITGHLYSDNELIARYLYNDGRYRSAVIDGDTTSVELYILKEAYRRLANKRGYSDEFLRA